MVDSSTEKPVRYYRDKVWPHAKAEAWKWAKEHLRVMILSEVIFVIAWTPGAIYFGQSHVAGTSALGVLGILAGGVVIGLGVLIRAIIKTSPYLHARQEAKIALLERHAHPELPDDKESLNWLLQLSQHYLDQIWAFSNRAQHLRSVASHLENPKMREVEMELAVQFGKHQSMSRDCTALGPYLDPELNQMMSEEITKCSQHRREAWWAGASVPDQYEALIPANKACATAYRELQGRILAKLKNVDIKQP